MLFLFCLTFGAWLPLGCKAKGLSWGGRKGIREKIKRGCGLLLREQPPEAFGESVSGGLSHDNTHRQVSERRASALIGLCRRNLRRRTALWEPGWAFTQLSEGLARSPEASPPQSPADAWSLTAGKTRKQISHVGSSPGWPVRRYDPPTPLTKTRNTVSILCYYFKPTPLL